MQRRKLLTGLVSLIAAPAIVRAGSLMPVKVFDPNPVRGIWMIEGLDEEGLLVREWMYGTSSDRWFKIFRGETDFREVTAVKSAYGGLTVKLSPSEEV